MNLMFRQLSYFLVSLLALLLLLYVGKAFFVPLGYAFLFSFLLYPLAKWFEVRGFSRGTALLLSLVLFSLGFLVFVGGVVWQVSQLDGLLPFLQNRLTEFAEKIFAWVSANFHLTTEEQIQWLNGSVADMLKNTGAYLKSTLSFTIDFFVMAVLVPFLAVLIVYQREKFVNLIAEYLPALPPDDLKNTLLEAISVFYRYIKGLLLVYCLVAMLNTLGLWLLGINNAVFYGILTALLTVIPYFGILIGAIFPITEAWITYESVWYPLGVIGIFVFVQYIEANLIFPIAVGHNLKLNVFATLLSLLIGGLLWGGNGMVLFLPFTAMFRMIAQKIKPLQPIARFLEEDSPKQARKTLITMPTTHPQAPH